MLSGELAHKGDSTGTASTIRPWGCPAHERWALACGTVSSIRRRRRACTSCKIWILPEKGGIPPSYEEKQFPAEEKRGRLRLIASPRQRRRVGEDSPERACLRRAVRRRRSGEAGHCGQQPLGLRARGTRSTVNGTKLNAGDALKLSDLEDRSSSRPARTRKSSCSTCRRDAERAAVVDRYGERRRQRSLGHGRSAQRRAIPSTLEGAMLGPSSQETSPWRPRLPARSTAAVNRPFPS